MYIPNIAFYTTSLLRGIGHQLVWAPTCGVLATKQGVDRKRGWRWGGEGRRESARKQAGLFITAFHVMCLIRVHVSEPQKGVHGSLFFGRFRDPTFLALVLAALVGADVRPQAILTRAFATAMLAYL